MQSACFVLILTCRASPLTAQPRCGGKERCSVRAALSSVSAASLLQSRRIARRASNISLYQLKTTNWEYQISSEEGAPCPNGWNEITSKRICDEAMRKLGKSSWKENPVNWDEDVSGCFNLWDHRGHIAFNTNRQGGDRGYRVCRRFDKATPAPPTPPPTLPIACTRTIARRQPCRRGNSRALTLDGCLRARGAVECDEETRECMCRQGSCVQEPQTHLLGILPLFNFRVCSPKPGPEGLKVWAKGGNLDPKEVSPCYTKCTSRFYHRPWCYTNGKSEKWGECEWH